MARNIVIVNATQVVTSEQNPQGLLSVVSGYPKIFDSTSYGGDIEKTMMMAKADYYHKLGDNYEDTNPKRVMMTVTLEMANGDQILHESLGSLPTPEPTPEETEEE